MDDPGLVPAIFVLAVGAAVIVFRRPLSDRIRTAFAELWRIEAPFPFLFMTVVVGLGFVLMGVFALVMAIV